MSQFEEINWSDVPGNKYVKALHISMLSEYGYVQMQKVKQAYRKPRMCNVTYDREYVIVYIIKRFLFALASIGIDKIHALIDEAWEQMVIDEGMSDVVSESVAS